VLPWYQDAAKEASTMTKPDDVEGKGKPDPKFQIQIDRAHYTVARSEMSGAELRRVPPDPIGPERDLFEVGPGHPDRRVEDDDTVEMRNGQRFFTAPAQINPGRG
jgi:hypothetical protein